MSEQAEPSVVSAEHKDGEIVLTLRWPHRQEFVPLSVGDSFDLSNQLTVAQKQAIEWHLENDVIKVNV